MFVFKIFLILYGFLLLVGGYLGYAKAHSKISLMMGIASGLLILISAYLLGVNLQAGQILATVVSGLLTVVFLMRVLKVHTMMPSGMLLVMSVVMLLLCLKELLRK